MPGLSGTSRGTCSPIITPPTSVFHFLPFSCVLSSGTLTNDVTFCQSQMALTVTVAVALGTLSTGKYIVGPGAHYGEPFDCAVREYAYEYAQHLQGWRGADKMREVFGSLELATLCNVTFDTHALPPTPKAHVGVLPTAGAVAYVAAHGTVVDGVPSLNDSGTPFQSVHHAVQAIRAERASLGLAAAEAPATIVLRRGTHYMTNTLELTPEDSHIKFMNYPGEPTAMSGAKPLRTTWKEVGKNPSDPSSGVIYSADLSGQGLVGGMPGLRVDGKRGFRASFPDRNPELSIFPDGWVTDGGDYSPPIPPAKNETYVTLSSPMLHDKTMFQQYMVGVGGHCALYDPPVSYWCSEDPSGGGAFAFRVPSGLSYKGFKSYKDPTGAVVVAWRPAHWVNDSARLVVSPHTYLHAHMQRRTGCLKLTRGMMQRKHSAGQRADFREHVETTKGPNGTSRTSTRYVDRKI